MGIGTNLRNISPKYRKDHMYGNMSYMTNHIYYEYNSLHAFVDYMHFWVNHDIFLEIRHSC
jgi:hypothetical protein